MVVMVVMVVMMTCRIQLKGKIFAIGGESDVLEPVNTMFILEPGASAWRETAGMRSPRARPGAAVVDGLIYVCGGKSIKFDPTGI